MKPLKPSHREKKRYLLLKGRDVSEKNIDDCIFEYIGVLGYAEACLKIIKKTKNSIILSINREMLDKVRASFLLNKNEIFIEKVSGSLKNLKE